jgi:DNA-binding response OmpR family regulator
MKKGTVLILDDSEIILEATKLALEEAGFGVVTLDSPFLLFETMQREKPDVVLVDVNMPQLSGDRVLEVSNAFGAFRETPVLLYSTLEESELRAMASRYRADGFVRKSLDRQHLLQEVDGWVRVARERRSRPS